MTTSTIEEKTIQAAAGAADEPKTPKNASVGAPKPRVAPAKAKTGKKAKPGKKADSAPQAPAVAPKKAKAGKGATPAEGPMRACGRSPTPLRARGLLRARQHVTNTIGAREALYKS